ncbi:hypothetical protein DPMN_000659, partial [Dreissena polymorpha]
MANRFLARKEMVITFMSTNATMDMVITFMETNAPMDMVITFMLTNAPMNMKCWTTTFKLLIKKGCEDTFPSPMTSPWGALLRDRT